MLLGARAAVDRAELLAKMLLLSYRDGLSDRRAMEALRFDLRWKVALDLPIDHPGFHPTSLVKFRARLLLHGKERVVFERSLELAGELGLLDGAVEQIVDSTPMLGRGAVQDTVTLVRAGVAQAVDAVAAVDASAARGCARALAFDYARPREKPAADWRDEAGARGDAGRGRQDAQRALRAVEQDEAAAADEAIAEAAAVARNRRAGVRDAEDEAPRLARHGRQAGSSLPTTPRCVTVARRARGASPATSCTPRRRPRRRW